MIKKHKVIIRELLDIVESRVGGIHITCCPLIGHDYSFLIIRTSPDSWINDVIEDYTYRLYKTSFYDLKDKYNDIYTNLKCASDVGECDYRHIKFNYNYDNCESNIIDLIGSFITSTNYLRPSYHKDPTRLSLYESNDDFILLLTDALKKGIDNPVCEAEVELRPEPITFDSFVATSPVSDRPIWVSLDRESED